MNALTPPLPEDPADRTARHLRTCRELAELGMDLARNAAQAARQEWEDRAEPQPAPNPAPTRPAGPALPRHPDRAPALRRETVSPSLAFTRLAHCVRQIITLEARLAADHEAHTARAATRAADRAFCRADAIRRQQAPEPAVNETMSEAEIASLLDEVRQDMAPYRLPSYFRPPAAPPSG